MEKILVSFSVFIITLSFISCTKETGLKKIEKLSAADCPRVASLTVVKKEALYTVSTFAGANGSGIYDENFISIDGLLCDARFQWPWGIAITPDGIIYVSDFNFANIRKINTKGVVSTFAGTTIQRGTGDKDGTGTAASFINPKDIVLNNDGYLFLLDGSGSLRKISPFAEVSTIIKNRQYIPTEYGYQDGPLHQAKFGYDLHSIAMGPDGSLFLYDSNYLIRKISPEGLVSTFAGQKPINGQRQSGYRDGPKENALFGGLYIQDMAFGPDGSLYICDTENKKIRRVTQAGIVETVADLQASFIAITKKGVIYAAYFTKIFRIDTDGTVYLVAGKSTAGHRDGVGEEASFTVVKYMTIHKNYLYMADGSTVRRMNIE